MLLKINWPEAIKPLLKKYKGKKHPLDYENIYQLVVMVILSAQDSDRNINKIAPKLFEAFPDMEMLSHTNTDVLSTFINGVRNFANKAKWLVDLAQKVKKDKNIEVYIILINLILIFLLILKKRLD